MRNDYLVFILTHGRAEHVSTYHTLRRCGYTGPIKLIVDNEDQDLPRYRELYPGQVIVFDKAAIAQTFDEADPSGDRKAVVYARNACWDIAKDLGYPYFIQLDDDYRLFDYRFTHQGIYTQKLIHDLNAVFDALLDYYESIPALTLAMGQSGDYIGGRDSTTVNAIKTKRKAMNTFICSVDRPFQFMGRINEDVNAYVTLGLRGDLFLTVLQVSITQAVTQQQDGGMTDLYLNTGTYRKSFYTIMYAPSCVRITVLGLVSPRLHHGVDWDNAVPKIIRPDYQKGRDHASNG